MLISCDNKGCFKTSNALFDKENDNVICQECGNAITNVSTAMKRTLVSFGQIVRTEQRKGFLMACKTCNANRQVVLNQHGDTICKQCHSPIAVQKAFLAAMESTGALERVQVEDASASSQPVVKNEPVPQARKVIRSSRSTPEEPQVASALADADAKIAEATKKASAAKKKTTRKKTTKKATKKRTKKTVQKGE